MKRYIQSSWDYTPLYHGTTFKNMLAILQSDELRGNISNETESYGVSTTRNKDTAYDDVSLVLDKDLLRNNFKVNPVYRESIFDRDLAEERIDRTIPHVSKYIKELVWNDRSNTNIKLRVLRRRLVENFENVNYTNIPGSAAYYIKKICNLAEKKGIPVDDRLAEAKQYIDLFDERQFDYERYKEMAAKKLLKQNRKYSRS